MRHSCRKLVGHSCGTLLWDTLIGHSCGTLFWDTLVGHSCRKLLWDTLVGHSCGTLCGTPLWVALVGHSCGTLLWDTLVGHSCGTLFWDTLVGHSCGSPVLSFQLHRLLRVLKLYYKVASSQLPAPQIAPRTKVVLHSRQFSASSSTDCSAY